MNKIDKIIFKQCPKCKVIKDSSEFSKDNRYLLGLSSFCRECSKQIARKWKSNNKEIISIKFKEWNYNNYEQRKEYRKKNKSRDRKTRKLYLIKNRNHVSKTVIQWQKNNPEKVKEIRKRTYIKNMKNIHKKLSDRISSVIWRSIRDSKNGRSWEILVGYNIEQLKKHLEDNFTDGMSWNNYGQYGWHIDHKIPLAVHNFEKPDDIDFKKAWALENLQPLWANENHKKSNKLSSPFQPSLAIRY